MPINKGYLTSDRTSAGDEVYTPFYAVEPLAEFIPKDKVIWCPFDEEWSAFYQFFRDNGYNVVRSSLKEGYDFFHYEPEQWDIMISNPPFYSVTSSQFETKLFLFFEIILLNFRSIFSH